MNLLQRAAVGTGISTGSEQEAEVGAKIQDEYNENWARAQAFEQKVREKRKHRHTTKEKKNKTEERRGISEAMQQQVKTEIRT